MTERLRLLIHISKRVYSGKIPLPIGMGLSTNNVELSNKGHGEHRASREAGDGSLGQRKRNAIPGPIGNKVVARGRAAYTAERSSAVWFTLLFFSTGAKCSNQAGNYYIRGDGDCFSSFEFSIFRINFHCFCGAVSCRAVPPPSCILGTICFKVMQVGTYAPVVLVGFLGGGWSSKHLQVACFDLILLDHLFRYTLPREQAYQKQAEPPAALRALYVQTVYYNQDSTPPGANFRPGFLQHMPYGTHTTKIVALERFRGESCINASLDVFSTSSQSSRNPHFKIVRGGGVRYLVCDVVRAATRVAPYRVYVALEQKKHPRGPCRL